MRNIILKILREHIQEDRVPRGYWNPETLKQEAEKYKTEGEFIQKSGGAYQTARRMGIINQWTKNNVVETSNIFQTKRPGIVYKITFINDKIYIGSDIQKDLECYHSFYCGSFDERYVYDDLVKHGYDGEGLPFKKKERLFYSDNITRGELIKIENQFIKQYNSDNPLIGYNKPRRKK